LEWCSLHHPPRQFCAARSPSRCSNSHCRWLVTDRTMEPFLRQIFCLRDVPLPCICVCTPVPVPVPVRPTRKILACHTRSCHARSRQQQCPVHTNIQVPVVMGQIRISWAGRYVAA
jgi:hypothetical protein